MHIKVKINLYDLIEGALDPGPSDSCLHLNHVTCRKSLNLPVSQ